MGLIIVIICALVLAAIAIVIGVAFGYQKNPTLKAVFVCGVGIAVGVGIFCMILGSIFGTRVADLKQDYADLTLYQPMVEATENEYIRYDFYNKVREYNENYRVVSEISENGWYGVLTGADWNKGIDTIDFRLHGTGGH